MQLLSKASKRRGGKNCKNCGQKIIGPNTDCTQSDEKCFNEKADLKKNKIEYSFQNYINYH